MRVLITGASGMVGIGVARALAERTDHRVTALVRGTSTTTVLEEMDLEFRHGDLARHRTLADACEGMDIVFHCGELRADHHHRELMTQVNMEGLQAVMESAVKHGVKRFIMVSTVEVLGERPQENLDETTPYAVTGDPYQETKMEAEKIARRLHRQHGLPLIMLRPPYIYGPHDRHFLPPLVESIEQGDFRFIGDGMNPMSLVHVDNLAEAMIRCIDSPRTDARVYHIADADPVTRRSVVNLIADELGLLRPERRIPAWIAQGMLKAARLTNSQETARFNPTMMKLMHLPQTISIQRAREELGFEPPVHFSEGMRATLAWFRAQRKTSL